MLASIIQGCVSISDRRCKQFQSGGQVSYSILPLQLLWEIIPHCRCGKLSHIAVDGIYSTLQLWEIIQTQTHIFIDGEHEIHNIL